MTAGLYACLHVAEFPAQAMLRLRPELRDCAAVILEGDPPFERACSANLHAAQQGAQHGMTRTQLESLPGVRLLRRSPVEERSAAGVLAECASLVSPRVEEQSAEGGCTLVADIAGTERLLGEPARVAERLLTQAATLGFAATVAVSHNFHTAMCLARAGSTRVVPHGGEAAALAPLPVAVLQPAEEHAGIFDAWGIRTLEQLAELPEEGLIARLGQEGRRLRQLALGQLPHLFQPLAPAFTLEESTEFDSPVELLDSLLFALHPMLDQLLLRARTRALSLASVTVTLLLESHAEHVRQVRPAVPVEDKALLLNLLQLDLAANPPAAAIKAVRLWAEPGAGSKVQLGLFSPQVPEPARLDVTLARIRAIVGQDRVGCAVLDDAHGDSAFHMAPFTLPAKAAPSLAGTRTHTALRRLRPAEPSQVSMRQAAPCSFTWRERRYRVDHAYGPWYSSGAWWSSAAWSQEWWDVLARAEPDASLLCCRLLRDMTRSLWQVEALYD